MNAPTLKALRASIAHWKRMAERGYGKPGSKDEPTARNCALCAMFAPLGGKLCQGCPVMNKTTQQFCIGTPYSAARRFWRSEIQTAFKRAASKELAFLRSLLPQPKAKRMTKEAV